MTVKALLKEAKKMDIDERTVLAHMILSSVEEECEDAPLTEELKAELDRRIKEHEKNPDAGYTWEEVKRKLVRLRKKKRA
jgi:putative addiction module component (TIGR02574 family)